MASKSKQRKLRVESSAGVIFWATVVVGLGFLQNKYGQFSDVRGFYGMRFMDGLHHWPYSTYIPLGSTTELHPIEYPALTGLVVWLLTFLTPTQGVPILNYFYVNVIVNLFLFVATVYLVKKLSSRVSAYCFLLAPAVVMSLNHNWDLWAVLPMIASIYYFEKKQWHLSAILLGVAIAVKFFPIVLFFPIAIFFIRKKEYKLAMRYFALALGYWLLFNLPFMLTNFTGWKYFYDFSFQRRLGEGSFYSIFVKLGTSITFSSYAYYLLNLLIFAILAVYLLKSKSIFSLAESSFFVLFAFTLFGKQYSMQYVIWLAPLAVIAMARIQNRISPRVVATYVVWQVSELAFHYSYFQNMVSNYYLGKHEILKNPLSNFQLGVVASVRYLLAVFFVYYLAKSLYDYKNTAVATSSLPSRAKKR